MHRHLGVRRQSTDAGGGGVTLTGVTHRHHHLRAPAGQHPGGVVAQAGVGAGDDRHASALIGYVFLSPSHALEHTTGSSCTPVRLP